MKRLVGQLRRWTLRPPRAIIGPDDVDGFEGGQVGRGPSLFIAQSVANGVHNVVRRFVLFEIFEKSFKENGLEFPITG